MIYEFINTIHVETDIGYVLIVYVRDGGSFSNDVFAIVSEVDGKLRHFCSGQFRFLPNPTFNIENLGSIQDKKEN